MRRKSSAAADQVDPRDLIEHLPAEHSSPSVPSPRAGRNASAAVPAMALIEGVSATGRHRRVQDHDSGAAPADSPTGGDSEAYGVAVGRRSEVRATTSIPTSSDDSPWAPRPADTLTKAAAVPDVPDRQFSAEPDDDEPIRPQRPAGVSGTSGTAIADLHAQRRRRPAEQDSSIVEIDRAVQGRRSRVRRFAPLGVGAAAVLVAAMVLTLLQPSANDPALSTALVDASHRSPSDSAASGLGDGGGSRLGDAAQGANGQIGPAIEAADAAKKRAEQRRRRATSSPDSSSSSGGSSSGGSSSGGPVGGLAQVAGDGIQAALKKGWSLVSGDEFKGNSLSSHWTPYEGEGHAGNGRRTASAISVQGGNLVIRGDSQGNTGGMAWGTPQKYGKWEMRAKFPKGDRQYHPVLLLWPSEVEWPRGGEIDFAETNSANNDVSFFLHYGGSNSQVDAKKNLDITQWNNYAVEWTPNAVVGYINGVEWFRSTDPNTLPPGPMHPTIQLDYFPDGGAPAPSEMRVAWMRQYS